jgi:hypothetical protein
MSKKAIVMVDLLEKYFDTAVASSRISEGEMLARMFAIVMGL